MYLYRKCMMVEISKLIVNIAIIYILLSSCNKFLNKDGVEISIHGDVETRKIRVDDTLEYYERRYVDNEVLRESFFLNQEGNAVQQHLLFDTTGRILLEKTYLEEGVRKKLYRYENGLFFRTYLNDQRDGIWYSENIEGDTLYLNFYEKDELYYKRKLESDGSISEEFAHIWTDLEDTICKGRFTKTSIKVPPVAYLTINEDSLYVELDQAELPLQEELENPTLKKKVKNSKASFHFCFSKSGLYVIYGRLMLIENGAPLELTRFERELYVNDSECGSCDVRDLVQ